MLHYYSHRILQAIFVLLFMSFACYILIGLMPGDPIDIMLAANPEATAEDAARLRAIYGLDQPLVYRYFSWLKMAVSGDFGYSRLFNQPVTELLAPRLVSTFILMIVSLGLAFIIALPAGIYAAYKKDSIIDRCINFVCFTGISMPAFWFALIMMTVFSVTLGWLPAGGYAQEDAGFFTNIRYMILPVLTLSFASIAGYTRYIRSAMIETLSSDYIRTARAKGCSEFRVVLKHGLRGALAPVITILSLDFGTLFGGALITETVFARPGMGKLIYDSILGNDYNLALIALLCVTFMILIGSLLADLAYSWLDPRIRLSQKYEA